MMDLFLVASNISVEPRVYRLAIVAELAYKHIYEVRNLCDLLKVGLLSLLERDVSASSNWKLVQHGSPL
eukprot:1890676-Ditylum_brightwellii.AAC.1